ncbi:hypothetical protein GCM10009756_24750 [Pseudokineococcus marinus]
MPGPSGQVSTSTYDGVAGAAPSSVRSGAASGEVTVEEASQERARGWIQERAQGAGTPPRRTAVRLPWPRRDWRGWDTTGERRARSGAATGRARAARSSAWAACRPCHRPVPASHEETR